MDCAVSVIVASYRREAELRRALESLAGQTFRDFEIILVDDNGDAVWNKRVQAIVEAFRKEHDGIFLHLVVNKAQQGSATARNTGVAAASGSYVTFLDDDDIYLPEKIEHQLSGMGDADYSITDLRLCYEDGREAERRVRSYIRKNDAESLLVYHLMHHMTGTDALMFRRDYFNRLGGFPPIDVGDEFYLMHRAIMGGGRFAYVPCCDIVAYVHSGEQTGLSSGEAKIQGENRLYEFKKDYFKQLPFGTVRYIKMRHYAVLAFAEIRRGNRWRFFCNGLRSFFCSPCGCIKLLLHRASA